MNIMILNQYAGGGKYGPEYRPLELGRELVKLGHDVTVITASYAPRRLQNPNVTKSFTEEYIDGVRYVFFKTRKYKLSATSRYINIFNFVNLIKRYSKKIYQAYMPDFIVDATMHPYTAAAAKAIARFNIDTHFCCEIHSIWSVMLAESDLRRFGISYKLARRAEICAIENADSIVSTIPYADRYIEEIGFHNTNYVYMPNCVIFDNENALPATDEMKQFTDKLRSEGKLIVMYLGAFSKESTLLQLVQSADLVEHNVHIIMVGDGPAKADIKAYVDENHIDKVTLFDAVEKDRVVATLQLADVLYVGGKRTKLYKYGMGTNKLAEYMQSARPIISAIDSPNDIVLDASAGISIKAEDIDALVDAINDLYHMTPQEREAIGRNGYNYAKKNNDGKVIAKRFLSIAK